MSTTTDFYGGPCRRRVRRELISALLYADFGGGNGGIVLNLSEEGFCVAAAMPFEAEGFLSLRLKGGGDAGRMEAGGQVIWMSSNRKTVGVRFVELSRPAREKIKEWIALLAASNRTEPPVGNTALKTINRAPPAGEHRGNYGESPFLGGEAGKDRILFQRGKLLDLRRVPAAQKASVSSDQAADGRGDLAAILVGRRLGSKALAGSTIFLVSVLGFVLGWGAVNLRTGRNDATRILNVAPAKTIGDQASAPRVLDKPQLSARVSASQPTAGPAIVPKPVSALAHNASDGDFQRQVAAIRSRPREQTAPQILASSPRSAAIHHERSQPPVRPEHERRTAALQQHLKTALSRSAEPVSPIPTGTVRMPIPPDGTAAPSEHSLTAAVAASPGTDASPEIPLSTPESHVAKAALSGLAENRRFASHVDDSYLIHSVPPVYPPKARKRHLEGMVELRLVVDTDGRVRSVDLVTGSPLLAPAAMHAARQFRYRPALLDGQPIETIETANIYFQLKH